MRTKPIRLCMGLILVGALACSAEDEKPAEATRLVDSLTKRIAQLESANPGTSAASPMTDTPAPQAGTSAPEPGPGDSTRVEPSQKPVSDRALDPGLVLDVWLWDGEGDLKLLTRDRSLGSMVATEEYFRFNQVNTDEALRSYWGRPMILKWSGYLKIEEDGPHSLAFELFKEYTGQGWSTEMKVQTIADIGGMTMFEKTVEVHDNERIFEPQARVLRLRPGYYTVNVWLAVYHRHYSNWSLPSSTQLGTVIKIRPPSARTPVPIQPSQVWHDRN